MVGFVQMSPQLQTALGLTGDSISDNRAVGAMGAQLGWTDDDLVHDRWEVLLALIFAAEAILLAGRAAADEPEEVRQAARRGVSRLSLEMRVHAARGLGLGQVHVSTTFDEFPDILLSKTAEALTPHLNQLIGEWIERDGVFSAQRARIRSGKRR